MKQLRTFVALATLSIVGASQAQAPIAPFLPAITENFNLIAPGSYANFIGYGGQGGFNRIGVGGLLVVTNAPALLPPISGNAMFGRGVSVQIRYQQVWRLWGGWFRVPNAGIAVNTMTVQFWRTGVMVGVAVMAPVNNFAWQWRGWDTSAIGGYDEVRIFGNGSLPGYVGMDDMRTR